MSGSAIDNLPHVRWTTKTRTRVGFFVSALRSSVQGTAASEVVMKQHYRRRHSLVCIWVSLAGAALADMTCKKDAMPGAMGSSPPPSGTRSAAHLPIRVPASQNAPATLMWPHMEMATMMRERGKPWSHGPTDAGRQHADASAGHGDEGWRCLHKDMDIPATIQHSSR